MSNTVITIDEGDDVTDLSSTTNFTPEPPKQKRKWTSGKDKNSQRIQLKIDDVGEKKRRDGSLISAIDFMDDAENIDRKVQRNKKYIEQQETRNPDFVRPMTIRAILREVNATLVNGYKPISKTTVLRYHKIGLDKRRAVGAPPTTSMTLLNCMCLHIKVLQVSKVILKNFHDSFTFTFLFTLLTYLLYTVSKKGQVSGRKINRKIIAAAVGTCYEVFRGDWAWRHILELWPDEISPSVVSQQESIRNEWTTYTKVNDWYKCNKKMLIASGLDRILCLK